MLLCNVEAAWWSDKILDTEPQDLRLDFWLDWGKNLFYEQNENFSYTKVQNIYTWMASSLC